MGSNFEPQYLRLKLVKKEYVSSRASLLKTKVLLLIARPATKDRGSFKSHAASLIG
jgi:hypothetical protein